MKTNWRKVIFWLIVTIILWLLMAIILSTQQCIIASRVVANEWSAQSVLKMLFSIEHEWRKNDIDGNGIKDYWTADVSCFRRFLRADGYTKVGYIDISFAKADVAAFSRAISNPIITDPDQPDVETWLPTDQAFTVTPKSGYYYRAMLLDENGVPYNQNSVGKNQIKVCNTDKFAFVAYPQVYGMSGTYTWIVNEKGILYGTDCGSNDKKVILQWPVKPLTLAIGPGGKPWRTEDEIYDEWVRLERIRQVKESIIVLAILVIPLILIFIAIYKFFNALGLSRRGKISVDRFVVIELFLIVTCGIIISMRGSFDVFNHITEVMVVTLLLTPLANIPFGFIAKLLLFIFRRQGS